jgi:phosphotransferase system enzyme I (PtsI)
MQGIAGSPGVIVGRALVVDRRRVAIPRRHLDGHEIDTEIQRLRAAIEAARTQLQAIRARIPPEAADHALILDAHLLMLDDQLLIEQCEQSIREEQVNAEWALRRTVEKIKELFDRADDDYFRERRTDVDFVGERILRHLMGAPQDILRPREADGPVILVAHELSPADTAALARSAVVGFVTDVGSSTSHTAIMARALSLPAVVGAADATRNIATGDLVVVDGLRGEVVLRPGPSDVAIAEERGRRYTAFVRALGSNRDAPCMTRCGTRIALRANIELPAEAAVAIDHGADGIGLYRTEFLYVDRREPPTEEEQFEVYKKIVETVAPRTVTLRTFDIGGDKFSSAFRLPREMNPALGLRAVRLALRERDVFRTQLRAMLRAAKHGNVRIMIPMISAVFELRQSKQEIALARKELKERGIDTPEVPIGIMVETPSAVLTADLLAQESAFFSIGTNDLIQYSLAIDRGNEHVAHLSRPFDPSIIRSLAMVANAAKARGIPCALCGAMAGNILAVPALLGLGVNELSVEPSAVPEIKAAIARTDIEEARAVMAKALLLSTADEVEALLKDAYFDRFEDLINAGEEGTISDTGTFLLKDIKAPQASG